MRILSAKFIISMLLIGAFYLPINAYNYLDDVENVTANGMSSAYTIYTGMPYADYVTNFSKLSNWTGVQGSFGIEYYKNNDGNEPVVEKVSVIKENDTIYTFDIHFFTDDYNVARDILKKATANLTNKLGYPQYKKLGLESYQWPTGQHSRVFVSVYQQKPSRTRSADSKYKYHVIIGNVYDMFVL